MSVLIKGMEMPNKKNGAVLIIYPDGKCAFEDGKTYQAVPVPPHGRLGDLDALIDKFIAKYLEHERKGELVFAAAEIKQDIVDLISDAPTIIPAEEDE